MQGQARSEKASSNSAAAARRLRAKKRAQERQKELENATAAANAMQDSPVTCTPGPSSRRIAEVSPPACSPPVQTGNATHAIKSALGVPAPTAVRGNATMQIATPSTSATSATGSSPLVLSFEHDAVGESALAQVRELPELTEMSLIQTVVKNTFIEVSDGTVSPAANSRPLAGDTEPRDCRPGPFNTKPEAVQPEEDAAMQEAADDSTTAQDGPWRTQLPVQGTFIHFPARPVSPPPSTTNRYSAGNSEPRCFAPAPFSELMPLEFADEGGQLLTAHPTPQYGGPAGLAPELPAPPQMLSLEQLTAPGQEQPAAPGQAQSSASGNAYALNLSVWLPMPEKPKKLNLAAHLTTPPPKETQAESATSSSSKPVARQLFPQATI